MSIEPGCFRCLFLTAKRAVPHLRGMTTREIKARERKVQRLAEAETNIFERLLECAMMLIRWVAPSIAGRWSNRVCMPVVAVASAIWCRLGAGGSWHEEDTRQPTRKINCRAQRGDRRTASRRCGASKMAVHFDRLTTKLADMVNLRLFPGDPPPPL